MLAPCTHPWIEVQDEETVLPGHEDARLPFAMNGNVGTQAMDDPSAHTPLLVSHTWPASTGQSVLLVHTLPVATHAPFWHVEPLEHCTPVHGSPETQTPPWHTYPEGQLPEQLEAGWAQNGVLPLSAQPYPAGHG